MMNFNYVDCGILINNMYSTISIISIDSFIPKRKKIFDYFIKSISYDCKKIYELRFENKGSNRKLEIQDILIRKKKYVILYQWYISYF